MKAVAKACLEGAEGNTMTFPQVVGALMAQGFEAYGIDLRRAVAIYYTPNGESVELSTHKIERSVAASFDAVAIQSAIQDAQRLVPGYTYLGFCEKIASAGCAAYMVSFSGRRALYIGRTAETHVEYFPK
ncbi:MAG TPA: DUF1398 family protein [Gemmatimonadaceae bacterium]